MQCKYNISARVCKILEKAGFTPILSTNHTYTLRSCYFNSSWNVEDEYSAWVTARGEQPEQQELLEMVCFPRFDAAYIQAKLFWLNPRMHKFLNFFMYNGARSIICRQLLKALFFIKKTYRISPMPIVSAVLERADAPMLRWRVDNVGRKKERVVPFLLYEEKHASLILSQAMRYLVFEFYVFKELFRVKHEKKSTDLPIEQMQSDESVQLDKNSVEDELKQSEETVYKRKTTRMRKMERLITDKQMSLDILAALLKNKRLFEQKRMLLQAVYDLRKTAQSLNNSMKIIKKIKVTHEYQRNKLYIQLAYFFMYMYYQPGILRYYKIEAAAFAVSNIKNMPRPRPVLETPFRHTPQNWWYGHYGYPGIHKVTEVLRPVSVHLRSRQRPGVGYD